MFWNKQRDSAASRSSVKEDWRTRLSADKQRLFDRIVREWEDAYAIFSVSLDDAMSLRAGGKLVRARQCANIAASSIGNLTEPLAAACRALGKAGRHLVSPPAVVPLNPGFYRGEAARQRAHWNQLMHAVLFGGRQRFLYKLHVLESAVSDLTAEFRRACDDLPWEHHPDACWRQLDELHYDVNTCLREIIVVLKSFLVALPANSLASFQNELNTATAACEPRRTSSAPAALARRAGHFRRE